MKLTKVNIAKVAVPSGKTEIIAFDDDVPGFGLRVRAGGSRQWIFQYRQGSKQRRAKPKSYAYFPPTGVRGLPSNSPVSQRTVAITGKPFEAGATLT